MAKGEFPTLRKVVKFGKVSNSATLQVLCTMPKVQPKIYIRWRGIIACRSITGYVPFYNTKATISLRVKTTPSLSPILNQDLALTAISVYINPAVAEGHTPLQLGMAQLG